MILMIDDANMDNIRRIYDKYPVEGVTTNPTILKRAGRPPMEVLKEIRAFIPAEHQLHCQAVSLKAEDMVREVLYMHEQLGDNTYVKLPATDQGIKALKTLYAQGVRKLTATAIYSPAQALMAAKAGAYWLAPYINRIDNMGADGVNIALRIHDAVTAAGLDSHVIGASFKNSEQIMRLAECGVMAATAAPDVLEALVASAAADKAVADFTNDFYALAGEGKTMLDF